MADLTLGVMLALACVALVLHWFAVALAKALRTYSRSRLESVGTQAGHPDRGDLIAHRDEATERAAESLAVLSGLALAALLGATAARVAPRLAVEAVVGIALALGAIGHVLAGVVGRVHAEALLVRLWPLAGPLRKLMLPFTAASRMVEAVGYRLARRSAATPRPASVEVEIHSVDAPAAEDFEADLPESTREVLERVVELTRRDVSELLTPRSQIVSLPASVGAIEAARVFQETGHSRVPLFGENRDDIVGILHVKDLFAAIVEAAGRPDALPLPRKLARPAYCVPETKNANDLLEEFRARRTHLAVVLDEYGGVVGLITLEDLIEHLVGPIDDEHDSTTADPVVPLGGSAYEVDAALAIEQLNERLGLHLPTNGDYQTVGGLAFTTLGRVPEPGASFTQDAAQFTVTEVGEHAIRRLRVELLPSPVTSEQ